MAEWIKNITGLGAGEYQPYDLVDADCDQKCASNSSETFYDYNGYCDGCKQTVKSFLYSLNIILLPRWRVVYVQTKDRKIDSVGDSLKSLILA